MIDAPLWYAPKVNAFLLAQDAPESTEDLLWYIVLVLCGTVIVPTFIFLGKWFRAALVENTNLKVAAESHAKALAVKDEEKATRAAEIRAEEISKWHQEKGTLLAAQKVERDEWKAREKELVEQIREEGEESRSLLREFLAAARQAQKPKPGGET